MDHLHSARLKLRPVAASDRAAVMAGVGDLAVSRWLSVVPYPYSDADFDVFLGDIATPGDVFAIEDADGFCGIVDVGGDVLGYWLAPSAHGKGYATEAARIAVAARFAVSAGPMTSGYFAGNARSANVLKKLGFIETGQDKIACRSLNEIRPHVNMRLTREAFIAALPTEAQSARLTYRSPYPVDLGAMHAIVEHWDVTRMLGSKWPWPADPAFTASRCMPYAGSGFVWAILRDGHVVGSVAVTDGELGYSLHPDHHRQGIMLEATQTALAQAFGPLGMTEVSAWIWADNTASAGLLAKLGFVRRGARQSTSIARPKPNDILEWVLPAAEWRNA